MQREHRLFSAQLKSTVEACFFGLLLSQAKLASPDGDSCKSSTAKPALIVSWVKVILAN
jgi:hypothetical protein